MYKSKDFDYELWTTTENGTKHFWTRVKATGEVTEVSHKVMKFLRAKEKKMYREITAIKKDGSPLSLDIPHNEEKEHWNGDYRAGVGEMETILFEEEFRKTLTPNQILIFDECLLGNMSETVFAAKHNISIPVACKRIAAVRKKAKKFFGIG